jgi:hypothetical protein
MMGSRDGGHMMGSGGAWDGEGQEFLEETAGLRKELHDKKFEYRETLRNPKITIGDIKTLEKEMYDLKEKIREKAPLEAQKRIGGYGGCSQ